MSKQEFMNIPIPENIDEIFNKGTLRAVAEMKSRKKRRVKSTLSITAASLIFMFALGFVNPSFAAKIPLVKSIFKIIENSAYVPGNYSKYSSPVNINAESNGVNVTLSDVICDGSTLYVSYIVKAPESLKNACFISSSGIKQLYFEAAYSKASFSKEELHPYGLAGLEGSFLDDNTFAGMMKYDLSSLDSEVPDEFNFEAKIDYIAKSSNSQNFDFYKGNWEFKIPVKVDKSLTKIFIPNNAEKDGYRINSVLITPFEMKIKTSHPEPKTPDEKYYFVKAYSEKGDEIFLDGGGKDGGKGIWFSRIPPKGSKSIRIELYYYEYPPNSTVNPKKVVLINTVIDLK